jgi:hypothetical protein
MRAQVVGRTLEWWCEADGATMSLSADEPVLGSATLRFVETHSAHDGELYPSRLAAESADGHLGCLG